MDQGVQGAGNESSALAADAALATGDQRGLTDAQAPTAVAADAGAAGAGDAAQPELTDQTTTAGEIGRHNRAREGFALIGTNADGQQVYQREDGARQVRDAGGNVVRMKIAGATEDARYQTADEAQAGAAASPAADATAAPPEPANEGTKAKALQRIERGTAYFASREKAEDFIAKAGIGDTHEAVQVKPNRLDVRAKQQAATPATAPAEAPARTWKEQAEEAIQRNREAIAREKFKKGEAVEFTDQGPFTKQDGTVEQERVLRGTIDAIDGDQGRVKVVVPGARGNADYYVGASAVRREGAPSPSPSPEQGSAETLSKEDRDKLIGVLDAAEVGSTIQFRTQVWEKRTATLWGPQGTNAGPQRVSSFFVDNGVRGGPRKPGVQQPKVAVTPPKEVTSETARRGEFSLSSGAQAKVTETAQPGLFSVSVKSQGGGWESYGTFRMSDKGEVSAERSRANWAAPIVNEAANTFAAMQRGETTNVADAAQGAQQPKVAGQPAAPAAEQQTEAQPAAEPAAEAAPQPSANTIFTEDAAAKARERLKAKLGRVNAGIDPEMMLDGITLAGYHIERGARTFAAYARAMVDDLGDAVKPYLKSWYAAVKMDPRAAGFDGMDNLADVEAAQIPGDNTQQEEARSPSDSEVTNDRAGRNQQGSREAATRSDPQERPAAARDDDAAVNLDGRQPEEAPQPVGEPAAAVAPAEPEGESGGRGGSDGDQRERDGSRGPADVKAPASTVSQRQNFTITNELDFVGAGEVTKYRNNVAAIRLLKQIEAEGRTATAQEQSVLAKYVGWGGLPKAFDARNSEWAERFAELKELLTEQEWAAAARSTQDAHYTSREVVEGMWSMLSRLGFDGGRVLEPSMGTGNFFGLMLPGLRSASRLTGVELDSITGRIARQLYPRASVNVRGFNETRIQPDTFDAVIGNPPFGSQSIFDAQYPEESKQSIHNYFFMKSVASLRPGGVMAMVVSNFFMDAQTSTTRAWIADRARLLGAFRLPNTAFKSNAGTSVTTDIVILQRLAPGERGNGEAWVEAGTFQQGGESYPLNRYFIDNPGSLLGNLEVSSNTTYGRAGLILTPRAGAKIEAELAAALETLPKDVYVPAGKTVAEAIAEGEVPAEAANARVYGHFTAPDGRIMQRQPDYNGKVTATVVQADGATAERLHGMMEVRDATRALIRAETDPAVSEVQLSAMRDELNRAYDAFVKKHGYLSRDVNKRLFREDPDSPLLLSLEKDYDRGVSRESAKKAGVEARKESAVKADIFTKRTNYPVRPTESVTDAKSAMLASLNERGRIDMQFIQRIYPGKAEEQIEAELGDLVFRDGEQLVPADAYLSGNVKAKLAEAIEQAKADPRYQRNVEALSRVQPPDKDPVDIFVRLGTPWIPISDYSDFARETFEGSVRGNFLRALGRWEVSVSSNNRTLDNDRWGTDRMGASSIIEALMTNKPIAVYDKGPNDTRVLNQEATSAAKGKAAELEQAFAEWIWKDAARRERLARYFNDTFNTDVPRKFNGGHMTFPGMNRSVLDGGALRPHQSAYVYRALQDGRALADHVVGAGKTYAAIATVMEMRRLGLSRKPMIVVPNHLVDQWAKDFVKLYPGANVLAASRKDFEKSSRQRLFSRIATGDWDAVIVAHSSFGFIPLPPEQEQSILEGQVAEIQAAIAMLRESEGKSSMSVKQLQKQKEALEEKLARLAKRPRDQIMDFAEMGIDSLTVDEAHEFKNLFFATSLRGVAGLGNPAGSKKAFDLFVKTRYLMERNGDKGVFFLTGTPVSNTLSEVFHMQRYLQFDQLKERGLHTFDAWAGTFGAIVSDWEMDAAGRFKEKSRFSKFANMKQLTQIWSQVADVVSRADLIRDAEAQGKRFPLPKIKGGKPTNVVAERSQLQASYIGVPMPVLDANGNPVVDEETGVPQEAYAPGTIIHRMDNMPKDPKKDNHLKATNDARKAGLDFRLIEPNAPDFAGSKVNEAANRIIEIWKRNDSRKGTQLVFCDLSVPASARGKSTEKAQAKMPTFFVRQFGRLTHVDGKKVTLSAMPEGSFFLLKDGRNWQVHETTTGLRMASGTSRQDAIDDANAALAENREAFLRNVEAKAIPQEEIDAYLQSWEEQQAQKQDAADGEGDGEADAGSEEDSISMDDLLADQSSFSVYDDLKAKLIAGGIPAEQVAFIHDYDTDLQKAALFGKVNRGEVRVLMGSTKKMGAGMNVQRKLVALHHLDAPWRPSDLEQRDGRIIRQGNEFYTADPDGFEIELYRYSTGQTYDARQWEIIEVKARGIEDFRSGQKDEIEDVTGEAASAADMKGAASGNPLILESIKLRKEVRELEAQERQHRSSLYAMEKLVREVENGTAWAYRNLKDARAVAAAITPADPFQIRLGSKTYSEKSEVKTTPILEAFKTALGSPDPVRFGQYRGMDLDVSKVGGIIPSLRVTGSVAGESVGSTEFGVEDNVTVAGFIQRLDNIAKRADADVVDAEARVRKVEREAEQARQEMQRGFPKAAELEQKRARQSAVVAALRSGRRSVDGDPKFSMGMKLGPSVPAGTTTMRRAVLEQLYGRIAGGWTANVRVVDTGADLPANIIAEANRRGSVENVEGVIDGNTIWIVADRITSVKHALTILAHEGIGHYGMEGMLGDRFGQTVADVLTLRNNGGLADIAAAITERYGDSVDDATWASEAIAIMAERGVENSIMARVIAAARRFLRELGFKVQFSEGDLRAMIADAARFVRNGGRAQRGEGQSFSFAGMRSRGADRLAGITAMKRLNDGEDAETVRQETGWFKGKDGQWRYEISDRDARIKPEGDTIGQALGGASATIGDVLDHPRLFAAYPQLAAMPLSLLPSSSQSRGRASASEVWLRENLSMADARSVLLHELQHGIQNIEGFARGGNLEAVRSTTDYQQLSEYFRRQGVETPDSVAYEVYRRLAGEVEARNVQARLDMTDEDRRMFEPELTADVPQSRTIVIFNGKAAQDAPPPANAAQPPRFSMGSPVAFSRAVNEASRRAPAWSSVKDALANVNADARPAWLKALTRQQIVDVGRDQFDVGGRNLATDFEQLARQMEADANNELSRPIRADGRSISEIAEDWAKLSSRLGGDRKAAGELAALMHDTTLAGIDPSKTPSEPTPEYRALRARYNALPERAKALYRDVRDAYAKRREDFLQALEDRIMAAEGSASSKRAMIDRLRAQFESQQVKGPYFPLARFGEYWVRAKKADGTTEFVMAESQREQRLEAQRLRAAGYSVKVGKSIKGLAAEPGVAPGIMGEIAKLLDEEAANGRIAPDGAESLKDGLYQMFLQSLPEQSVRKHFIHRKGTPGFSADALRAFAHQMGHGSKQLARVRYAHRLADTLRAMRQAAEEAPDPNKAADIVRALDDSFQWMMNPTNARWANWATSLGFTWYLGITPAAALINLTQLPVVTLPVLASRFGASKAAAGLSRAVADYIAAKGSKAKRKALDGEFAGDMGRMLTEMEESGALDRTMTMSLFGLSDAESATAVGGQRVMRGIGYLFHQAELVNRESTAIAAYRLARQAGQSHDAARAAAYDAVFESHFDYSSSNRAAFMRGNVARVLLLFRQYAQNITYYLVRNAYKVFKGATPAERKEAAVKLFGTLGATFGTAGVMGLPGYGLLTGAASMLQAMFGDDDEPWDVDVAFRQWLNQSVGGTAGEVIAKGVANPLTGLDFASRTGMADLWIRDADRDLEGRDLAYHYLEQFAGPVFGIGIRAAEGAKLIGEGNLERGIEKMLPKFAADPLKALRFSDEGATTLRGDPIMQEFTAAELFWQSQGFSPAALTDQYERNRKLKNAEQHVLDRRAGLLNAYAMARRAGDTEGMADTLQLIQRFNRRWPAKAITAETIRESMRARDRFSQRAMAGVGIDPRLAAELQEMVGY